MIRLANKFDIPELLQLLRNYQATGVNKGMEVSNEETAKRILTQIVIGGGLGIVYEKENKIIGMLLAIKSPYLWDSDKMVMSEIAFWVEPEHRGSTAGYRLISEYVNQCEILKNNEKVNAYTISQMEGQDLNYKKFGFKPIESTWSN